MVYWSSWWPDLSGAVGRHSKNSADRNRVRCDVEEGGYGRTARLMEARRPNRKVASTAGFGTAVPLPQLDGGLALDGMWNWSLPFNKSRIFGHW